jgi:lysophospholipase L1-like esterase
MLRHLRVVSASTVFCTLALTFLGCGSSSDEGPASTGQPGTGTATDTGTGSGGGTDAPSTTPASGKFRTYVILGDSISDRGGEAPFFYDLLVKNDDAKFPSSAGKDLSTKFGADIKVHKASRGGARAVNLVSQITGLPTSFEGPVLVSITIGGNDVTAAMGALITGGDDTKDRTAFQTYLAQSLDELTKPDRFGPGVKVRVVLSNIYDPSDGTGNFMYGGKKCPGALGFYPAGKPTRELLDPWIQIMVEETAKHPEVALVGMREKFEGHGVATGDMTWFVSDCIHPNSPGHESIRGLFWNAIEKF